MLLSEFKQLHFNLSDVSVEDLSSHNERTLLLGETKDGEVFHVYLRDNKINRVIYSEDKVRTSDWSHASEVMLSYMFCVPIGGKVFPQHSDPEFCRQLAIRSVYIPFTEFEQPTEEESHKVYKAKTHYTLGPPADADCVTMEASGRVFMKALGDGQVYLHNNNTQELEVWFYNKHTYAGMSDEPRIKYRKSILNFLRIQHLPAPSSYNKA